LQVFFLVSNLVIFYINQHTQHPMSSTRLGRDYSSSLFFVNHFTLSNTVVSGKSGVKTGATVLAEENTSLFDYVHDNNFCLVVCLPGFIF